MTLLPTNFDNLVKKAIKQFWSTRSSFAFDTQGGSRGSVIAGKNMDGFSELIRIIAVSTGITEADIIITGKKRLTIPGYFRPTKIWDALVIYKGRLIAAFELKSQVGSFGNNFNNRSEESIGSATDFWTAFRDNAFDINNSVEVPKSKMKYLESKPPFLGYLMLIEDCKESTSPVKTEAEHFQVFPEFKSSSYAKRYQILCEKLISEGLYSSAALILSPKVTGSKSGVFTSPTVELSPKSLFSDFASRLLAARELYG
jgi:hypothetical protein